MSVVQPPRKRKCFFGLGKHVDGSSPGQESPCQSPCPTPPIATTPQISPAVSLTSQKTVQIPVDDAYASFIQHALAVANSKHSKEAALLKERDLLARKLTEADDKVRQLQLQLANFSNSGSSKQLSPSSSPTSTTLIEDVPQSQSNEKLQQSSKQLEQKNRELQRNVDLLQRDMTQCSQMLKSSQAEGARKDAQLHEQSKELEKLRQELTQTRQRLDGFIKSASEQAILAKSYQEELIQEREARRDVEGKLKAAKECIQVGTQIEARFKIMASEKIELEAELARLKNGVVDFKPSLISIKVESCHQSCQTVEKIAEERFIQADDEMAELQAELEGLQKQLTSVSSVAAQQSEVPSGCISYSQEPSPLSLLETEVATLKLRIADLEEELFKKNAAIEEHQRMWNQKCDQYRAMSDRIRDRDIQCAKYHYELEIAEGKLRNLHERMANFSAPSSNHSNTDVVATAPNEF